MTTVNDALRACTGQIGIRLLGRAFAFGSVGWIAVGVDPADLGVIDLLPLLLQAGAAILTLETQQGLLRLLPGSKTTAGRETLCATAFWPWLSACTLCAMAIAAVLLHHAPHLAWQALPAAISFGFYTAVQQQLRAENAHAHWSRTALVQGVVLFVGCGILVGHLGLGGAGLLHAQTAAFALAGATGLAGSGCSVLRRPKRTEWMEMCAYAAPLLPGSLAWWTAQWCDRAILASTRPVEELGAYAFAWRMALPAGIIAASMQTVLPPLLYRDGSAPAAGRTSGIMLTGLIGSAGSIASLTALLLPHLPTSMLHSGYGSTLDLAGPLAWSTILMAAAACFPGLELAKRTGIATLCAIISALCAVTCAALLVPALGPQGAAIATLAGSASGLLLVAGSSRRYCPVQLDYAAILPVIAAGVIACTCAKSNLPTCAGVGVLVILTSVHALRRFWRDVRETR